MSDLILAVVILTVIIALSVLVWNTTVENLRLKEKRSEIENLALSASDRLVRGLGVPSDWNKTTVLTIGLAVEDNLLSEKKVSNFVNLEKSKTKTLLGITGYNFIFRLRDTKNNVLVQYGDAPLNADEVVIYRRFVLYKNQLAYMDFGLWK